MGRTPILCNERIREAFLKAVRLGMSNEKACDYAGIEECTFYAYTNRAEKDIKAGKKDTINIKFQKEYKKAKADFILRHVTRITQASDNGTWQASAWLLERRQPKDFGLKINQNEDLEKVEVVSDVPTSDNE